MKVTIVAGARPNFMKIAPIISAIEKASGLGREIGYRLVHTGQHYDKNLSDTFFHELGIPYPHANLNAKSGSQAEQTAAIMIGFENELEENPSDLVMVVGDVNSTMACAIVSKKAGVKVAHVEAGIRSGDMRMPEEINRIVTDSLTDYFFTTSVHANSNLINAGADEDQVYFVGNVMIDTLRKHEERFSKPEIWSTLNLAERSYFVLTMHRPSNVDESRILKSILRTITENCGGLPIVFPVHPRTRLMLDEQGLEFENLHFVTPMGYLEFNYLVKHAKGVLTDSGGITEETTVMHVPCITLRENTERPETCEIGTNVLVGHDSEKIKKALTGILEGDWPKGLIPELWDGHAATRIVDHLIEIYEL